MDNDALLDLCNRCLLEREIPSTWIQTVLVGLCKKGKPKGDPESYRTIGLESCLLKFMTMLVNARFVRWAESNDLLPASQNGFREGYRTNNNMFVLKCAVDKARASRKPLFVAFVDMTNAFPSTDQPTLWTKLRAWGAGGQAFDWLRKLYREMVYVAQHNGDRSEAFRATIGILIGDTCSPILWVLYMADLPDYIPNDEDDVVLGSVAVTSLEQADDILLLSTSAAGLQRKMSGLYRWCGVNFMVINNVKSEVMIFGPKTSQLPEFHFGGVTVSVTEKQSYIGFKVSSRPRGFLTDHYEVKAEQARRVGVSICGLESLVGRMPVPHMLRLYSALVDPHLTHGCEVILDVTASHAQKLEEVQKAFLRRMLGLGSHSVVVVLYTETGLLPIGIRRLLLSIECVRYYAGLPRGHMAREAWEEALVLDAGSKRSWVTDLRTVVGCLPFDVRILDHAELGVDESLVKWIKDIKKAADLWLQGLVDGNSQLYLLHGRVEKGKTGEARTVPRALRHYLVVGNRDHRVTLTKLLVANHNLRVSVGRWRGDARDERWCRACGQGQESVEHVLLNCRGSAELVQERERLVTTLSRDLSSAALDRLRQSGGDITQQLRILVSYSETIGIVAAYASRAMSIIRQYGPA